MSLSSYRMHRIYLAATMNYGLGSDDPEELAYYNQIRKEMDDMKKVPTKKKEFPKIGIPLKKWINDLNTFLLIDGSLMLIDLQMLMIFKGKN